MIDTGTSKFTHWHGDFCLHFWDRSGVEWSVNDFRWNLVCFDKHFEIFPVEIHSQTTTGIESDTNKAEKETHHPSKVKLHQDIHKYTHIQKKEQLSQRLLQPQNKNKQKNHCFATSSPQIHWKFIRTDFDRTAASNLPKFASGLDRSGNPIN